MAIMAKYGSRWTGHYISKKAAIFDFVVVFIFNFVPLLRRNKVIFVSISTRKSQFTQGKKL